MEKKTQKTPKKYTCKKCDFLSSNKTDYKRHIKTMKHKMITYDNKMITKKTHKCFCGKTYNHRANLCRHRKKCLKNVKTNVKTMPTIFQNVKNMLWNM